MAKNDNMVNCRNSELDAGRSDQAGSRRNREAERHAARFRQTLRGGDKAYPPRSSARLSAALRLTTLGSVGTSIVPAAR